MPGRVSQPWFDFFIFYLVFFYFFVKNLFLSLRNDTCTPHPLSLSLCHPASLLLCVHSRSWFLLLLVYSQFQSRRTLRCVSYVRECCSLEELHIWMDRSLSAFFLSFPPHVCVFPSSCGLALPSASLFFLPPSFV